MVRTGAKVDVCDRQIVPRARRVSEMMDKKSVADSHSGNINQTITVSLN